MEHATATGRSRFSWWGKHEIDAASRECRTSSPRCFHDSRRAFDMPARPGPGAAIAAGRRPGGSRRALRASTARSPSDRACRAQTSTRVAGDHLVERAFFDQLAVIGHRRHAETTTLSSATYALRDSTRRSISMRHLGDVLGRARLDRGRQAAERSHVLVELLIRFLGDLADRLVQGQVGIFLRRPAR